MSTLITRRQVLIGGVGLVVSLATTKPSFSADTDLGTRLHQELINSSKYAGIGGKWTEFEFNNLIDAMGEDSLRESMQNIKYLPGKSKRL